MDTQNIRWDQPLEAVHVDGRVESVLLVETDHKTDRYDMTRAISPSLDEGTVNWFNEDGTHHKSGWTIRNVAPKEVEWGPAIPVESKRPEWLKDDDLRIDVWWGKEKYVETEKDAGAPVSCVYWNGATAIRLPANHPHYTTPTRTALEQRMEKYEAWFRRASVYWYGLDKGGTVSSITIVSDMLTELGVIVAELPEPVDEDIDIANEMARKKCFWNNNDLFHNAQDLALAAIKRGRALERGE